MATTVNAPLGSRGGHFLFVLVLVAHALLLSSQVTTERGDSALRSFLFVLFSPFQRGVDPEVLSSPEEAVRRLLKVVDGLGPTDTGTFRAWDGRPIPW